MTAPSDDGAATSASVPLTPEGEAFVRAVGGATDLPAFVRNVRSIGSLATDMRTRVAMLEQAIVQDVALSAKVLRIANTISRGATIRTVAQAIMLLGYDRVQHLATAASVYEQVERNAPAVQDLLVMSVLTANQGLCVAVEAGFARPETAYLCGLFRNLGELLVACYRPSQYTEWLDHCASGRHVPAGDEERLLGFTFDSVGRALAQQWGMPPDIVRTMRHREPAAGESTDPLADIVQFATRCARTRYAAGDTAQAEHELVGAWTRTLGLDRERIADALDMAEVEAGPTLKTMHVRLDRWRADRDDAASAAGPHGSGTDAADDPWAAVDAEEAHLDALAETLAPVGTDTPVEASVRDGVRQLVASRRDDAAFDVGSATSSTMATLVAAGYNRILLALSTDDFAFVRGRYASGADAEHVRRTFVVRPQRSFGPLGGALEARDDLFVVLSGADAKRYVRDRVLRELRPRSFALLPLVVDDRLIGCLYFDHPDALVEPSETLRELLLHARDQLVTAFQRRAEHAAAGNAAGAGASAPGGPPVTRAA